MTTARRISLLLLALTAPAAARAQVPSTNLAGDYQANLPVPPSPALSVLGLASNKVVRPVGVNDLAASLVNIVDHEGILQNGVAVDVAPVTMISGRRVERARYVTSWWTRVLMRTQASIATAKAGGGSRTVRLAAGVNASLVDLGDPRAEPRLAACIAAANRLGLAAAKPVAPPPPDLTPEQLAEFEAQIEKIEASRERTFRNACREDARERLWNRTAVAVGWAPTWRSASGAAGDLTSAGQAFWTSVAYGFEGTGWLSRHSQIIGYVERRTDGADAAAAPARVSVGGRWRVGTAASALSVEAVRASETLATGRVRTWTLSAAAQHKLTDDLWLSVAVGGRGEPGIDGRQVFVLNSLSWAYGPR